MHEGLGDRRATRQPIAARGGVMTRLVKTLELLGISGGHRERLEQFCRVFAKWNDHINLSAARTIDEIEEHVRDSLHVVEHLQGAANVLDVGGGGGFPVVPAAICCPAIHFTSLEPVHKKHSFLKTAIRELGLANLEAHASRIEDHALRDYDVAMSRATFDLVEWIRIGLERVKPGGRVLGFEATPRDDLQPPFERHPYSLDGKSRAIVVVRRSA
jgi:16S rRNA (guanine527-N7)-methyltransferase